MIFTPIAVLLVGIWMVITSQSHISDTGTLIWGVVVAALALLDLLRPVYLRQPPQ